MTAKGETRSLLLSDDLMFISRITGTGRDLGVTIQPVRSQQLLEAAANEHSPACVIVDLANPGLNISELVRFLKNDCDPAPFVVAYGSHVDTATLKAARDAGCDEVMPRSKFVEELPEALVKWSQR